MLDIRSVPIMTGDSVAYAALSYKRAHLRAGTVVAVDPQRMDCVQVLGAEDGRRRWHRPNHLCVVDLGHAT